MLFRLPLAAALALAAAPALLAQGAPPPAAPPAAAPQGQPGQGAPATPPRHTSTIALGRTSLTIEHGQPAWSDGRLAEMEQGVQVGARWRMGSEDMTTLVVKDGPVLFGGMLLEPGRWGMNLQRLADKEWGFLAFKPIHTDISPYVALGDEVATLAPAALVTDAKESVANLTIDLAKKGDDAELALAWGPMRAVASIQAVAVTHEEFQLNEHDASATWYGSAIPEGADLARPYLAGTIDLEIGEDDCSFNVYLMQEGANLVALLRSRERDQAEQDLARCKLALAQFEAAIQQFGPQAEAQIGPMRDAQKRKVQKAEVALEDSERLPDHLKFTEPASDAKGSRLSCTAIKTRSGLHLEVHLGPKHSVIRVDESQVALKASG